MMKKKDLKYDFLPSSLEIIEKPANPLGSTIIIIIAFFIAGIAALSYFFHIDVKVNTRGQAALVDGVQIVNAKLSGKILAIHKKESDFVNEGDIILTMENNDTEKAKTEIEQNMVLEKIEKIIVVRKLKSMTAYDAIEKSNLDNGKKEELKQREQIYWEEQDKNQKEYEQRLKDLDVDVVNAQTKIEELQFEYENLFDIDFELNGDYLLNEIESCKETIVRAEKEKKDAVYEWEQAEKKAELDLITKKNQIRKSITNMKEQLDGLEDKKSEFSIKAPVSGTILKANYNTIGAYLDVSANIAEIVPQEANCNIVTTVENKYRSKVEKGQQVLVKLDTYDFQKYGGLSGKVVYIAPNATVDESTGQAVYSIKIELQEKKKIMPVLPGMSGNIEISVDRVRLIEYFLSPFFDIAEEAF